MYVRCKKSSFQPSLLCEVQGLSPIELGKRLLTHSHTMTPLMPLGNEPFENTVGKRKIARNEQFLIFPQCFLLV